MAIEAPVAKATPVPEISTASPIARPSLIIEEIDETDTTEVSADIIHLEPNEREEIVNTLADIILDGMSPADIHEMETDDLIAHVITAIESLDDKDKAAAVALVYTHEQFVNDTIAAAEESIATEAQNSLATISNSTSVAELLHTLADEADTTITNTRNYATAAAQAVLASAADLAVDQIDRTTIKDIITDAKESLVSGADYDHQEDSFNGSAMTFDPSDEFFAGLDDRERDISEDTLVIDQDGHNITIEQARLDKEQRVDDLIEQGLTADDDALAKAIADLDEDGETVTIVHVGTGWDDIGIVEPDDAEPAPVVEELSVEELIEGPYDDLEAEADAALASEISAQTELVGQAKERRQKLAIKDLFTGRNAHRGKPTWFTGREKNSMNGPDRGIGMSRDFVDVATTPNSTETATIITDKRFDKFADMYPHLAEATTLEEAFKASNAEYGPAGQAALARLLSEERYQASEHLRQDRLVGQRERRAERAYVAEVEAQFAPEIAHELKNPEPFSDELGHAEPSPE